MCVILLTSQAFCPDAIQMNCIFLHIIFFSFGWFFLFSFCKLNVCSCFVASALTSKVCLGVHFHFGKVFCNERKNFLHFASKYHLIAFKWDFYMHVVLNVDDVALNSLIRHSIWESKWGKVGGGHQRTEQRHVHRRNYVI